MQNAQKQDNNVLVLFRTVDDRSQIAKEYIETLYHEDTRTLSVSEFLGGSAPPHDNVFLMDYLDQKFSSEWISKVGLTNWLRRSQHTFTIKFYII